MPDVVITVKTRRQYNGIDSIMKTVRSNSAAASYNFARRTATSAKRRVHVITGHLRDSIRVEKVGYGEHKVVVGAGYGVYEEYGTRYRPPHPYFRPAVEENKALFFREMQNVFKRGAITRIEHR